MDLSYQQFMRRASAEYVSADEIISRRMRAGACIMCGSLGQDKCGCVGMYLYKDEDESYRLRRNKRSTLPHGIITNVLPSKSALEVLRLFPRANEIEVPLSQIIDLETAVRDGVDIDEKEKRVLSKYLTALEHASDLSAIVDE